VEYPGTCLIVSHDRYFLDNVATRLLWLEPGSSRDFDGSYSELWEIRQAEQREAAQRAKAVEASQPKDRLAEAPNPMPAVSSGGPAKAKKKPKGKARPVEIIESDIARAEAELATVSAAMSTPEVATDPVRYSECHQQYEKLTKQLEALYAEWELVVEAGA
jgi:ATP-binding cassette subfamily F protein 3